MLIQELFEQIEIFVGKPVTITGRLVVTGDSQAFLTSGSESLERDRSVFIRDESAIAQHLLRTLPAYVGGAFLYDEECTLTGTIQRGPDSLQLCHLLHCNVRRNGLEVEIPLDA